MAKTSCMSKAFAAVFGILTILVTGTLVGMVVYYNMELQKLNPTPPPTVPSTTLAPPPEMRLRGDVLPESYKVFIQVYFYTRIIEEVNVTSPNQTLTYDGNVTVHLKCVKKTKTIFLHSRHQEVFNATVKNRDSNKYLGVEECIFHKDESDFLEIVLNEALEVGGNYSLFLNFSADINEYLDGLYLSTYQEGEYLVATNLEPTSARSVFPCFDEPAMKARFTLTVIHRKDTIALANEDPAGIDSNLIGDDWLYTRFHPTEVMSTYLFAFTVSEFTAKKTNHLDRKIYTYARPEATEAGHTDYAVSITGKILDFYQDYFDIGYTQKLDQIALPDLGPQAMENWGLVMYQEGGLLYQEGVSSHLQKEEISFLIAHELAHQWFGNLVTMKWWNEVWLNEGFATYMSSLAVDRALPSLKVRDMFLANQLHIAFEADSLASSHPLTPPAAEVQTTDQIVALFDQITYSKGSAVLTMLEDVLGERVFHKGIKVGHAININYESFTRVDIKKVMNTWTNQIGYPVITINTSSGDAYQKQFLYNDTSESKYWRTSNYSEEYVAFYCVYNKMQCVKGNVCSVFSSLWEIPVSSLPLLNRGQLIDDAFNLARAKQVSVILALNSTRFLRNETEYLPWESATRNLQYFIHMFDRSEVYGPMKMYLQNQVKVLYNFFKDYTDNSTVPDVPTSQFNQINAIKVACSNGLPECLDMIINKQIMIHPNLRSTIYCQAIAAGGQKEWEFAWDRFQSTTDLSEKYQLSEALTCTKKIWLLNRYLGYTLDSEKIRLMDVSSVIGSVAKNEAGQALAWNFIRANWDYVSQQYVAVFTTPPHSALKYYIFRKHSFDLNHSVVQRLRTD
uniref:Aminopeptidase n=1 Tax=Neogobius melanostomus TaxID=47308 RepID=A0A8C6TIW3_9GOBI